MTGTLADLLGMDANARRFGCGMNPRLRAAIETELRFPARAAGPAPRAEDTADPLPDNVTRLCADRPDQRSKKA